MSAGDAHALYRPLRGHHDAHDAHDGRDDNNGCFVILVTFVPIVNAPEAP